MTPLHIAAARGNLSLAFLCLRNGSIVDALDKVRTIAFFLRCSQLSALLTFAS